MRQLNGIYTQKFNRRHARVGHLFQGRFKGILIEREAHLLEVLRYVVLNPVRAGLVDAAEDWPWSSYRATAGDERPPGWLATAWTLAQFSGTEELARRRYRDFVAEGRGAPRLWAAVRGQIYLGSETFVESALGEAAGRTHDPEIPVPQRQTPPVRAEEVVTAVSAALRVRPDDLKGDGRGHVRERAILAYTLRRFAGATGKEMAPLLGVRSWQAARLARAGEREWGHDSRLADALEARLRPTA
jgi:hypothetical protein